MPHCSGPFAVLPTVCPHHNSAPTSHDEQRPALLTYEVRKAFGPTSTFRLQVFITTQIHALDHHLQGSTQFHSFLHINFMISF